MKKNIALMAGGNSGEAVVSLRSAVEVEKNIDSTIYNVYKIVVWKRLVEQKLST